MLIRSRSALSRSRDSGVLTWASTQGKSSAIVLLDAFAPASNGYPASKAAEWSLTNGLRLELADQKTQVTALATLLNVRVVPLSVRSSQTA